MADGADIVPLFPDVGEAPLVTQEGAGKPHKTYCGHEKVELDTEARRLYCRACGREVPAFDYLEYLARDFERYRSTYKEARRQAAVTRARVEELKRQERNAKARLRRGGVKIDRKALRDVEWAAGRGPS